MTRESHRSWFEIKYAISSHSSLLGTKYDVLTRMTMAPHTSFSDVGELTSGRASDSDDDSFVHAARFVSHPYLALNEALWCPFLIQERPS